MLPRRVRYALRALRHLARSGAGYQPAHRIAEEERLPGGFLDLILLDLRQKGILESARGAGGGYRLAVPADGLSILEILETLQVDLTPLPCLTRPSRRCEECAGPGPCVLRPVFEEPFARYRSVLADMRLSDFANMPSDASPWPATPFGTTAGRVARPGI